MTNNNWRNWSTNDFSKSQTSILQRKHWILRQENKERKENSLIPLFLFFCLAHSHFWLYLRFFNIFVSTRFTFQNCRAFEKFKQLGLFCDGISLFEMWKFRKSNRILRIGSESKCIKICTSRCCKIVFVREDKKKFFSSFCFSCFSRLLFELSGKLPNCNSHDIKIKRARYLVEAMSNLVLLLDLAQNRKIFDLLMKHLNYQLPRPGSMREAWTAISFLPRLIVKLMFGGKPK